MNIADELSIPGRIETVYANLIDPEVLKRCIPGCQELEKTSDTDYAAKVILKIAKGGADVELIDHGDKTILRYSAKAETGGKIAQLGARLIESTAKKLAKKFFSNFEEIMLA